MNTQLVIGNKNYSSWSLRAWLLLREAGIEFDERRIALDTPSTKRELIEASEAGRVPVLRHDGMTVWDSMAIAETVAELWPDKQLWPTDRNARVPSGFSGPGGTILGKGSPSAACSSRTDCGGYQAGFFAFAIICVSPSGVSQSIRPMLIG